MYKHLRHLRIEVLVSKLGEGEKRRRRGKERARKVASTYGI